MKINAKFYENESHYIEGGGYLSYDEENQLDWFKFRVNYMEKFFRQVKRRYGS
jgi:hypothetical protein